MTLTISIAAAGALPTPAASAAPSNLTQTLNATGTVTLNWTPVPGATSYTVTVAETTSLGVAVPPVTTTVIKPVAPATTPAGDLHDACRLDHHVRPTCSRSRHDAQRHHRDGQHQHADQFADAGAGGIQRCWPMRRSGSITLQWANNPANKNNVAGLLLTWTGATPGSFTFAPTTTGATLTGLTSSTAYGFTLQAVSNVTAFNSARGVDHQHHGAVSENTGAGPWPAPVCGIE